MGSKEKVIARKHSLIAYTQQEIEGLEFIETGRFYKIEMDNWRYERGFTSWGVPIAFNLNDVRFQVVASDCDKYTEEKAPRGDRLDTTLVGNNLLKQNLRRVKKEDLPLLLGLPFVSSRLEKIMQGKTRVKLD